MNSMELTVAKHLNAVTVLLDQYGKKSMEEALFDDSAAGCTESIRVYRRVQEQLQSIMTSVDGKIAKLSSIPEQAPVDQETTSVERPIDRKQEATVDVVVAESVVVKFPVVDDLRDIPSCFYYYNGSHAYDECTPQPGIYVHLYPNVYISIDLTSDVSSGMVNCPIKTVRCKYGTTENCRRKSKPHTANNRPFVRPFAAVREGNRFTPQMDVSCPRTICNFTHLGEYFNKLNSYARCPQFPTFGNMSKLPKDVHIVQERDLQTVTYYGMKDLILSYIWWSVRKPEQQLKIIENINRCYL